MIKTRVLRKILTLSFRLLFLSDMYYLMEKNRFTSILRRKKNIGTLNILIVCHGNICRSPFAALLLERHLRINKISGVNVSSAGFIREVGRYSPEHAIEAAKKFRIDLRNRRSISLNDAIIDNSDIIFCMDIDNYLRILRENFMSLRRTFFLGSLSSDPANVIIQDPYAGSLDQFLVCYSRIDLNIRKIFHEIKKSFPPR